MSYRLLIAVITVVALYGQAAAGRAEEDSFPKLSGPYLGQEAPGLEPELFAPGILPTDGVQHCFPAFSPDGKEVYWMRVDLEGERPRGEIRRMRELEGLWHPPELAPFSGEHNDHAPVFSRDGKRIYFSSSRPGGIEKCKSIWYVENSSAGLGEPVCLGSPPNTDLCASQATFTDGGTVYFVGKKPGAQWGMGIYRSRFEDGEYKEPEALGGTINTTAADVYPFISRDGSYLIFGSSRPGTFSPETDLYLSLLTAGGGFAAPKHLGESINNGRTVSFSFVTHDGKYLFFSRFDGEAEESTDVFYWADAKILDPYLIRPGQN